MSSMPFFFILRLLGSINELGVTVGAALRGRPLLNHVLFHGMGGHGGPPLQLFVTVLIHSDRGKELIEFVLTECCFRKV